MSTTHEIVTSTPQTCAASTIKATSDDASELRKFVAGLNLSPKTSTIKVIDGPDSGYGSSNGSQRSSPDTNVSKHYVDIERSLRPKIKLQFFDNEAIPQPTQDRFNNLTRQYENSLFDYVCASPNPQKVRTIGMTLELLGESKETATPWVWVQIQKGAVKKARKFFRQAHVKEDYEPTHPTIRTPHLRVLVREEEPKKAARLDDRMPLNQYDEDPGEPRVMVYGDTSTMVETICGSRVTVPKFGAKTTTSTATVGGLVRIVGAESTAAMYALTAGHFLDHEYEDDDYDYGHDGDDEDGDSEISDDDDDDDERYELDLSSIKPESKGGIFFKGDRLAHLTQLLLAAKPGVEIGPIFKTSRDDLQDQPNLDWALIDINNQELYLPNIVSSHEVAPILPNPSAGSTADVILSTATRGPLTGTLSKMWSYLSLSPGKSMARTYLLTLSDGEVIQPGDSGTWVVDASTNEAYGHIVASDAAGRAHVIPLSDIFEDIRLRLASKSVELPLRQQLSAHHHKDGSPQLPSPQIAHDSKASTPNQGDGLEYIDLHKPQSVPFSIHPKPLTQVSLGLPSEDRPIDPYSPPNRVPPAQTGYASVPQHGLPQYGSMSQQSAWFAGNFYPPGPPPQQIPDGPCGFTAVGPARDPMAGKRRYSSSDSGYASRNSSQRTSPGYGEQPPSPFMTYAPMFRASNASVAPTNVAQWVKTTRPGPPEIEIEPTDDFETRCKKRRLNIKREND